MKQFPTILHAEGGDKKKVNDEGEYMDAIAKGFSDSPADFTPEAKAARKKAKALADAEAKKKAAYDKDVAEGLRLLDAQRNGTDANADKADKLAQKEIDLEEREKALASGSTQGIDDKLKELAKREAKLEAGEAALDKAKKAIKKK